MKRRRLARWWLLLGLGMLGPLAVRPASYALLGWNDLGMHCLDGGDYSIFCILPPYNTFHAQLVAQDRLRTSDSGLAVTYEAIADATGSINSTSQGKGNFWDYAAKLYGTNLPPDVGLGGFAMPGPGNRPQRLRFSPTARWFAAEGIPIMPYDDRGSKNYFPLLRLVARNSANTVLATADITVPVSDEMGCLACHGSGTHPAAEPSHGWQWDPDPVRDYKINILRLHDEMNRGFSVYKQALEACGYDAAGLDFTARVRGQPILCARCHASNAQPGLGLSKIPPLTQSIHSFHAYLVDRETGKRLYELPTRAACYQCHPGTQTRCLRGAMGRAVAADGQPAIECQSCHGSLLEVGRAGRSGWLEEPACQDCHTGTATRNKGQIRYTNAFETNGLRRVAADLTFATRPNTPSAGVSLYRFSKGHGGLYCSACHGSPHAEYPSGEANDNLQSQRLNGTPGVIAKCTACHTAQPATVTGGPHGLHPIGQSWVSGHKSPGRTTATCKPCHGNDLRGTVLSESLTTQTLTAKGTKQFWKGFRIGCYSCHLGPSNGDANPNRPAAVTGASLNTTTDKPATITLGATDADGNALTLRVVSQPAHGTVALNGRQATYLPEPGYAGPDQFRFAAWDGSTDSNLGTVNVTVAQGECQLSAKATAPTRVGPGAAAPFRAAAELSGCAALITYDWDFGDNTTHATGASVTHTYSQAGTYQWTLRVNAGGKLQTLNGAVNVGEAPSGLVLLTIGLSGNDWVLSWPASASGFTLEATPSLAPPALWQAVAQPAVQVNGQWFILVPNSDPHRFFRLTRGF